MRSLFEMQTIQIELTSACVLKCSNCTRFCGTHQVPFFMEPDLFKKSIDSLVDFAMGTKGIVGFMGGEPLLHPDFVEFCDYAATKLPRHKLGLWTTFPKGSKFTQYREVICRTFGNILLNDHSRDDIMHAPVLMAAEDYFQMPCPTCKGENPGQCETCVGKGTITNDADLFAATDRCWVQESWSAAINPKGAWFCEVAAALSDLFDGPQGWEVEPGWWKRTTKDFTAQREWACRRCGAALPISRVRNSQDVRDDVSKSNLDRLVAIKSKKVAKGEYVAHETFEFDPSLHERHGYPNQTYKDAEYRQGIAAKYGIYLILNKEGFWDPQLMPGEWKPKPSLFNILNEQMNEVPVAGV